MIVKCFKCQELKPITEFYKHKKMAGGHLKKCKECTKRDVHQNREKNIERIREYDRKRAKLPHRKKYTTNNTKKYRKKNPIAYAAQNMLNNAVRDGKIKKEPCQVCGSSYRIHGHHEDYYKPLEVQWVCAKHHAELKGKK